MKKLRLENFSEQPNKEELITSLYDGGNIDFSISYTSDFKNAKLLREIIDFVCIASKVCPKWRTRIVLVVDELNNNAIEYGSMLGDENIIEFHAHKTQDDRLLLKLSVSDTGKGKYAKKAEAMEILREKHDLKNFSEHHSIRGRGLFLIISKLVDRLSFHDNHSGGLTVTIEKALHLDQGEYS